jgi:hypothetical protein
MFFNYQADQAADPHRPNRQYYEILRIELLDAGFDTKAIEQKSDAIPGVQPGVKEPDAVGILNPLALASSGPAAS